VSLVRTAHYGESVSLYKGEHYSPGGAIPAIFPQWKSERNRIFFMFPLVRERVHQPDSQASGYADEYAVSYSGFR
jgi:hypothetical protein